MDFEHDDEQQALRDAVRGLVGKTYADHEHRRTTTKEAPGFDEKLWARMAEMGLLGLPFAEADGGVGAGPVEIGIVCQELGRVAAPEPYLAAVVMAGGLVAACGTAEQRAGIITPLAEGELLPVLAHLEPGRRWTASATAVTAAQDEDGWTLTGTKEPVPHGARADVLVVSAALPDGGTGVFVVDPSAATLTDYAVYDGSRAARVDLDGDPGDPAGRGRSRPHRQHRRRPRRGPRDGGQPVARRDADGALGDHRLPQEPQAVRRHAEHLPGPDVPCGRHVRLARADPEPGRLGHHGRRDRGRRRPRRRGLPRLAAGEPGRAPRRAGGDPAPRRHRDDGRVQRRQPGRPADRPRPPARRRQPPPRPAAGRRSTATG